MTRQCSAKQSQTLQRAPGKHLASGGASSATCLRAGAATHQRVVARTPSARRRQNVRLTNAAPSVHAVRLRVAAKHSSEAGRKTRYERARRSVAPVWTDADGVGGQTKCVNTRGPRRRRARRSLPFLVLVALLAPGYLPALTRSPGAGCADAGGGVASRGSGAHLQTRFPPLPSAVPRWRIRPAWRNATS